MIKKMVVGAVSAAFLAVGSPAHAAAAPTLTGPDARIGFGPVTLSGTAEPGTTVRLYESAIVFDDLEPADDWEHGGGPLTATAGSDGRWQIRRYLDSGFYFQVEAGGVRSNRLTVHIQANPGLALTPTGPGTVTARITADPAEPSLPAQLQMQTGRTWTTLLSGRIGEDGAFTGTARNITAGTHAFRAYIGADPSNGVLGGYSAGRNLSVGNVEFAKIQYKNSEWVQVTNRTATTVDLKGWTVRDAANHVYTFATTTRLGATASVYLHTGKGVNTATHRYWGRTTTVWNDGGDTAILRNAAGQTVDTCKWGAGSGAITC
jgi:hypothetical protein